MNKESSTRDTEWHQKRERLFYEALDLDEGAREQFLIDACEGDQQLLDKLRVQLKIDNREQFPPGMNGLANARSMLYKFTEELFAHTLGAPGPSSLRAGAMFGQYQLIRGLGRGGMGIVYLARDTRLGRRVAIKFLAENDRILSQRFLAEARVTARCKHDNIVDIYDIGEAQGHSYMVLEYLQGSTLREWLRHRWQTNGRPEVRTTQVSPTLAADLMVPVVRALAHAHSQGLVHRDLKPENIMLSDDGSIKVLDFGLAKVLADLIASHETSKLWAERSFQTRDGALVGTVPYMSPEQWGAGDIDARTDIWAVGIMLWELCTGSHPLAPLSSERAQTVGDVELPMPSLADERPQLGPLANVVDRCLRKRLAERMPSAQALLAELEWLLPGRPRRSRSGIHEPDNPYVGLAAFQRSDAERFFGRDRDIASMMARVRNHRLVTVAGASGAGKSSFIRAGVIPALERSGQTWESFIIRPGRQPLSTLADVLVQVSRAMSEPPEGAPPEGSGPDGVLESSSQDAVMSMLRSQPGYLGKVLRARCQQRYGRILLFVDQFEELYTLGATRDTREAFVRCLEGVADDAFSPLRLILAVRSDFIDRVAEDRSFTDEIMRGMTLLSPLSRDQLREALIEPLTTAGYAFECEAMVDEMLDTLQATRSPLPLLQFTAARLWEARDRGHQYIRKDSYVALGGIEGALAQHADAVLAGLSTAEQRLARALCTTLVSDERTRAIISLDELRSSVGSSLDAGGTGHHDTGAAMERVLRHLAEARLVLLETDSEQGTTVELIHQSLIDRWPRLVQWLAEDQDAAQFRTRLRDAARQWDKQGRTEDLLWRGQAADEAARWLEQGATAPGELGARGQAYLRAVVGLARRRRRRRRQLTALGFAAVSAIAIAFWLLAARAERTAYEAIENARQARNATRIASAREQQSDPTLVLALVRELEPARQLPPRWRELARWALHQDIATLVLNHPNAVRSAAFSPDATHIVTASTDNTARVWRADGTGEPVLLEGHRGPIRSAAFSPDGNKIVTASSDTEVRVWNTDGRGAPIELQGHEDLVYSAAFSPDGTRIVTASLDGTARIWAADGRGPFTLFQGHQDGVYSAAFSPDGTRIVTASFDSTARIWNADGRGEPIVLTGHEDSVRSAVFSPDGTRIVTASLDKTVRLWNADGTGVIRIFVGHRALVWSAAFSPDGTRIVTASSDKTVRVWNTDGTGTPEILTGHRDHVSSAVFDPDGTHILTASSDHTARVWNVDGPGVPIRLRGHLDTILSAAFSPDGTRIITTSSDKTARIWNADGTGKPILLRHEGSVHCAMFSPDGTRVVTASADTDARIWSADGTGPHILLRGHEKHLSSAAFSADGKRIVTASRDKTARVWNADGSGAPVILEGHQAPVNSAAFSPDGARIVTASFDQTARVWNADGSGAPVILRGHRALVYSAAFSPDGTRIITTSDDKTARIWRLDRLHPDGTPEFVELRGHESIPGASGSRAGGRAFSPDGARVLTIADDKTLRVWRADGRGVPAILRIPDLDAYSAAFSPDGTRIVTTSHSGHNPATDRTEYWATVWPSFEPFSDISDCALWTATRYCPPVELRVELLGVARELATRQMRECQARVAAAWDHPEPVRCATAHAPVAPALTPPGFPAVPR